MDLPSPGSSSNDGSLEMQARWITALLPRRASLIAASSRMSPLIRRKSGLLRTASNTSSPYMNRSSTVTLWPAASNWGTSTLPTSTGDHHIPFSTNHCRSPVFAVALLQQRGDELDQRHLFDRAAVADDPDLDRAGCVPDEGDVLDIAAGGNQRRGDR